MIGAGLLDQVKVITVKAPAENEPENPPFDSFKYALALANVI